MAEQYAAVITDSLQSAATSETVRVSGLEYDLSTYSYSKYP